MVWTAPRTFVAGEILTAAIFNTDHRDNLLALGGVWTAYTPTWTALTTNPVLGNGTFAGSAYSGAGAKTTTLRILLTMGSTTTYGSGQWFLTPPQAPALTGVPLDASITDSGIGYLTAKALMGAQMQLFTPSTTAGGYDRPLNATTPITFNNLDQFFLTGVYEAA